jgi:hypothetical protein
LYFHPVTLIVLGLAGLISTSVSVVEAWSQGHWWLVALMTLAWLFVLWFTYSRWRLHQRFKPLWSHQEALLECARQRLPEQTYRQTMRGLQARCFLICDMQDDVDILCAQLAILNLPVAWLFIRRRPYDALDPAELADVFEVSLIENRLIHRLDFLDPQLHAPSRGMMYDLRWQRTGAMDPTTEELGGLLEQLRRGEVRDLPVE